MLDKEDYVSFEVAKALQNKGYVKPCNALFEVNTKFGKKPKLRIFQGFTTRDNLFRKADGTEQYEYLAPSLFDVQKWFRRQEFEVSANFDRDEGKWFFFVQRFKTIPEDVLAISDSKYNSYEEALDAGFMEALKYL